MFRWWGIQDTHSVDTQQDSEACDLIFSCSFCMWCYCYQECKVICFHHVKLFWFFSRPESECTSFLYLETLKPEAKEEGTKNGGTTEHDDLVFSGSRVWWRVVARKSWSCWPPDQKENRAHKQRSEMVIVYMGVEPKIRGFFLQNGWWK